MADDLSQTEFKTEVDGWLVESIVSVGCCVGVDWWLTAQLKLKPNSNLELNNSMTIARRAMVDARLVESVFVNCC